MKVIFLVGPTASGKSELALRWAGKTHGAIVNCDSVQVFKSLNIGSSKPTEEDFKKVPHFLFDYVEEGQKITAGEYSRDFFVTLEKIKSEARNPVVFVVGGTGFYFQAIEKGMYPIGPANPEVLKAIENEMQTEEGAQRLYRELGSLDPKTAARISPNDHYRLARALEIIRSHGKTVTKIKEEFEAQKIPFPYPLLKLGLRAPREFLEPRVALRTEKMLELGLLREVRDLVDRGFSGWSALQSVGYKEALDFLRNGAGMAGEDQLKSSIVQSTLRLAKKQRTWFQRDPDIFWFSPAEESSAWERIEHFLSI